MFLTNQIAQLLVVKLITYNVYDETEGGRGVRNLDHLGNRIRRPRATRALGTSVSANLVYTGTVWNGPLTAKMSSNDDKAIIVAI